MILEILAGKPRWHMTAPSPEFMQEPRGLSDKTIRTCIDLAISARAWVADARAIGGLRMGDVARLTDRLLTTAPSDHAMFGVDADQPFSAREWSDANALVNGLDDEALMKGSHLDDAPGPAVLVACGMIAAVWNRHSPNTRVCGNLRAVDLLEAVLEVVELAWPDLAPRITAAQIPDVYGLGPDL